MRGSSIIVLGIAIGILILFFYYITLLNSHLFSKKGRNILYRDFYECGFKMIPDVRVNLNVQFFAICFIFLLYDIEIILLVPIFINIHSLPLFTYVLIWFIMTILILSYYYEWEKYALHWGLN